jgi:1-deoxy-D-xylulose-5-phosphate reductoisomerase
VKKRVAVLGATGSIGKSALDVLRAGKEDLEPVLFSSHSRREDLLALGGEFPEAALALSGSPSPEGAPPGGGGRIRYFGPQGLLRSIAEAGADLVVNGIAGAAGLEPSLAALETGADLALANKETIVMAAPLVFARAAQKQARIIPVDSEHAAIFSLLEAHGRDSLGEILLTASGGPFRRYSPRQLAAISPREALAHPTWNMGPKISVDSASLANKGLEVIEAAGLFHVPPEDITVVIHPQSIVHSMIRLKNGAIYAELSRPDMRLPLHNALYYPETKPCPFGRLDFEALTLEFERPDNSRFPMLPLAYGAVRAGGLYPAAYNAANERAVAAFLANEAGFLDIPRIVEYVLSKDWHKPGEDLASILEADQRARGWAEKYITEKN